MSNGSPMVRTNNLRFVARHRLDEVKERVLQQLWIDIAGEAEPEWRDVPLVEGPADGG